MRRSDVVLSVCPPALAEDVAREVAGHGFGGLYVDANAIAPARAERIAALFERSVDGSITAKTGIHLFLSGEPNDVELVCGLFGEPVGADAAPGGVGAASALKMAFAGWNKIGAVLEAQAYAVAEAYGLEDALAAEGVERDRIGRTAARAWRWTARCTRSATRMRRSGWTTASPAAPQHRSSAGPRTATTRMSRSTSCWTSSAGRTT